MSTSPLPRLCYLAEGSPSISPAALEASGLQVDLRTGERPEMPELLRSQLILIEVSSPTVRTIAGLSRRWRIELGEHYLPIAWIGKQFSQSEILEAFDSGADVVLTSDQPIELIVAQLKSLLRVQHFTQRLSQRAVEASQLNQRLQQAYQQMDQDLELTRRIHRGFLPPLKTQIGALSIVVNYRPRSRIGGDFFDILRLDEHRIGVYLADAMGTGLPASSLLSIFVKKCIRAKEISGNAYRLLPPDEILSHLNRELVALNLADPPFVTLVWLQIDTRDGLVEFARAAHPHPLHIPREGILEYWHAPGTLLGVFEATFPAQRMQLRPGSKMLLFSDGVHSPAANAREDRLLQIAGEFRDFPLETFVENVSDSLLRQVRPQEDFTLVGLEWHP